MKIDDREIVDEVGIAKAKTPSLCNPDLAIPRPCYSVDQWYRRTIVCRGGPSDVQVYLGPQLILSMNSSVKCE